MFDDANDVDIHAAYKAIAKMITMGLGINGEMLYVGHYKKGNPQWKCT